MKSMFVLPVIFLCCLQLCFGNSNEIDFEVSEVNPKEKSNDESCKICEEVAGNVISLRRSNATRAVMVDYISDLCINYTSNGASFCLDFADIKVDTVNYIIDNKPDLTPVRFCAIQFQKYGCVDPDAASWSIPLPPLPAVVETGNSYKNTTEVAHILHITDLHYDPLYKYGSIAENCKQPLCCGSGYPNTSAEAAGYWGDYRDCDTPSPAIGNLFFNLGYQRSKIDWIYFTGDIVSHRSWASSIQDNSQSIIEILDMFAATFQDKVLYPILGNHETHPADFFSPDSVNQYLNVSTQWLYDLSADQWLRWLPSTTEATIRKGGFYTVLVKPGFRIIALNSNVCLAENLWLVYDDKDPYGQLQWLVDVLAEAEKNGEKVHILSHVPPGVAYCHRQWSHEFKKIVLRFADTIAAQFNGHTHIDEFKLFFNSSTLDEVKSVAYNGGSFATFIGSNSNYRIYEVDNETMEVTNYDHYTFNLTKANLDPRIAPVWYKLYSFKDAYNLPDLKLESLKNLYWQMASNNSNNELIDKYQRYMYRESDVALQVECDEACKKNLVCLIAATETDEIVNC